MRLRSSRRALLWVTVGATVGSAGCLGYGDQVANETTDDCGDEDRWDRSFGDELEYGSNAGFALSVSPETVSFEEPVTVDLRNESGETKTTGTEELYTVQKQGDEWTNVFAEPGGFDGGVHDHEPGEGFDWALTFTRSTVEGSWQTTCGSLDAGTYRFVYFGHPVPEGGSSDGVVAVTFTVEDA